MKKLTTKSFIEKSRLVHGNIYDYSLVKYTGSKISINIICLEHGVFEQSPNSHLKGRGCPDCAITRRIKKQASTTKDFINKSNKIHNFYYDYSLVDYTSTHIKVNILCPEHGVFEQSPALHLSGGGCQKCAIDRNKKKLSSNTEEFIFKSNKIHQHKFDYSLSNYTNARGKIKIICPTHGMFEQVASSHLSGVGCQKCNESKGESTIEEFLVKHLIPFETQKTFDNCKYKRKLKFDFYLPNQNICIEFNGIQHYKENKRFGGLKALKGQMKRDSIKSNYCTNNNISLFIIKYNDDLNDKLNVLLYKIAAIT